MTPNDEDPIQMILPRDEAAVEDLIRKYHRVLKLAAIRILLKAMSYGTAEVEADGVLQEVYLDICKKGITGVKRTLLAYLVGIVRNKAHDRIRKRRFHVQLDQTQEAGRVNVEKGLENKQRLERARSRMSRKEQEVFDRSAAGQSGKEIAADLGTTPLAVRSIKNRVRTRLKKSEED